MKKGHSPQPGSLSCAYISVSPAGTCPSAIPSSRRLKDADADPRTVDEFSRTGTGQHIICVLCSENTERYLSTLAMRRVCFFTTLAPARSRKRSARRAAARRLLRGSSFRRTFDSETRTTINIDGDFRYRFAETSQPTRFGARYKRSRLPSRGSRWKKPVTFMSIRMIQLDAA